MIIIRKFHSSSLFKAEMLTRKTQAKHTHTDTHTDRHTHTHTHTQR